MSGGITWDQKQWLSGMRKLARQMPEAADRAAAQVAIQVLNDCVMEPPTVPMRTGNLRSTGTYEVVSTGTSTKITLGFNTPYAAAVHEGGWATGPLAGKTIQHWSEPSSGPKFLESKLQRHRVEYMRVWARKLWAAIWSAGSSLPWAAGGGGGGGA